MAQVGAIFSHHLGLISVGVPIIGGELVRALTRRQVDWRVLGSFVAALPCLLITLPMAHRSQSLLLHFSKASMHPVTLARLLQYVIINPSLSWPFVIATKLLFVLAGLVFLTRTIPSRSTAQHDHPQLHVIAASATAAALIPITLLAMMFSTGYYNCRYGIGCIGGIAILSCVLIFQQGSTRSLIATALLVTVVIRFSASLVRTAVVPITELQRTSSLLLAVPPDQLIVVADPTGYLPMWWYAPQATRSRMVYLSDKPLALQYGYYVVETALTSELPLLSVPVRSFSAFIPAHRHFYFIVTRPSPTEITEKRLLELGYREIYRKSEDRYSLYEMDSKYP